jgi:hypothetical protein
MLSFCLGWGCLRPRSSLFSLVSLIGGLIMMSNDCRGERRRRYLLSMCNYLQKIEKDKRTGGETTIH